MHNNRKFANLHSENSFYFEVGKYFAEERLYNTFSLSYLLLIIGKYKNLCKIYEDILRVKCFIKPSYIICWDRKGFIDNRLTLIDAYKFTLIPKLIWYDVCCRN